MISNLFILVICLRIVSLISYFIWCSFTTILLDSQKQPMFHITWTFLKISCRFSQDNELKRNSEDNKVKKDFLRDKA